MFQEEQIHGNDDEDVDRDVETPPPRSAWSQFTRTHDTHSISRPVDYVETLR